MSNLRAAALCSVSFLCLSACAQEAPSANAEAPPAAADAVVADPADASEDRVAPDVAPVFDVETLATGLLFPWNVAFLPDGELLIAERLGSIRVYRDGALSPDPVPGAPQEVFQDGGSGRHDIALDPDFEETRRVFLTYMEGEEDANRIVVWRGRYEDGAFSDGEVVFRAGPDKAGRGHPGGRIAFLPDKTFLLSVGDGYDYLHDAQDLSSHLGKVLRLDRDGAAPADNPFVGQENVRPEIWSYGHRNIQGLAIDPETGVVWAHEHGPRGGDEINRLEAGANFGWPAVTNGIDYDGALISERAHGEGFVSPLIVWAPSIAPSGLAVYRGEAFPDWDGHFFVGALRDQAVIRGEIDNQGRSIREAERLLENMETRIRDVRLGPDGLLYVLTDESEGRLLRLRPRS